MEIKLSSAYELERLLSTGAYTGFVVNNCGGVGVSYWMSILLDSLKSTSVVPKEAWPENCFSHVLTVGDDNHTDLVFLIEKSNKFVDFEKLIEALEQESTSAEFNNNEIISTISLLDEFTTKSSDEEQKYSDLFSEISRLIDLADNKLEVYTEIITKLIEDEDISTEEKSELVNYF